MRLFIVLACATLGCVAQPAAAQDRWAPAAAQELRQMCEADRARLWGVELCAPLLVADPATRVVWASQPDWTGVLQTNRSGYSGVLPQGITITSAAVDWAATRWIMLLTPLPEDATERRVLVAREAWHRVQDQLNLPQTLVTCGHLDTERGRYFLRLEMRALATALRSRDNARRIAARDAIYFRTARLVEFYDAAAQETALDRNEGLAAYTGVKLGAADNPALYAARTLDRLDRGDTFATGYADATGPAYGLILDDVSPNWRRSLGSYAPADLLRTTLRAEAFDPLRLDAIAARYGGPGIASEEFQRAHSPPGG